MRYWGAGVMCRCTSRLVWRVSPLRTLVLGAGVGAPGSSGLVPERVG